MTITLSQADYWEMFETTETDAIPDAESVFAFPAWIGQGHYHSISLREGIDLNIEDYCLNDDVVVTSPERSHPLEYTFEQIESAGKSYQRYGLYGSGLAPKEQWHTPGGDRIISINVHIEPAVFQQWIGTVETLPVALKPLLRAPNLKYFNHAGTPLAPMRSVFQQILHCPYHGLTRRLYLESKVWEMMTLLLDTLGNTLSDTVNNDAASPVSFSLKPNDVERIHHAGEILRSRLDNPPSLIGLARLVQINDHKLKVGFRQVFGTTVFGYLHNYRMEKSRQLLESGDITVNHAAQIVGFTSRSHFAVAFRKKFGMNPGIYRKHKRSAVQHHAFKTSSERSARHS